MRTPIQRSSLYPVVVLALCFFPACERSIERSFAVDPPLTKADVRSFTPVALISKPTQTITLHVAQQADLRSVVDLAVFGKLQPEIADSTAEILFGKPVQVRTDDFGGTWSRYPTSFGFVELGCDRRTSPTGEAEADKKPPPCRRSLRAFTSRPAEAVFRQPILRQLTAAEEMTPTPRSRELVIFDAHTELLLNCWFKNGGIEYLELFKHIDR
jgi:hypothetical protein